ncbi:efflux RND transporter periplasmic adaptor subunit [Aureimonas populi]|uniref:Efflux RND transporter periplasmic adaptor subunit n=1 Tax=Aureimonas populi TaxID=1701758 RepID=A0ABW5CK96_9HYPH|nr:efflux RND transporter periplasmic adaptor subunit [Aureimonas populi]
MGLASYYRNGQDASPDPASTLALAVAEPADGPVELAQIEMSRVARSTVVDDVRISGALRPVRRATIAAPLSGTIVSVHAQVGEAVAVGDVLVEFDRELLEAGLAARESSVAATQAQLDLAEFTLERSQRLGQSGFAAEAAVREAEASVLNLRAQLRTLEAELAQARYQLREARVLAPFSGVVSSRAVEPGQAVGINSELLGLVDPSLMEIEVGVPTTRIVKVQVGQGAEMQVDGIEGRRFEARVARVSPVAVGGSRAVPVFLQIDNEDGLLRGGMFAVGALRTQAAPDVIALPDAAIRRDEGGDYVLKGEGGRLRRQAVEIGTRWPDRNMVEVVAGLDEGDLVVTAPLPDLRPDVEYRMAEL